MLFRTLTSQRNDAAALFQSATDQARKPHWYVEGAVPDTIDGRFAMLATIVALAIVRLEQLGDLGNAKSVALTERFIAVMETEHRELGLGDPKLGRTVRKLVGSLSRRVALWRSAIAGEGEWAQAARESLYKADVSPFARDHSATALQRLWAGIRDSELNALIEGKLE